MERKSMLKRLKNVLQNNGKNECWNLDDQMVLSFDIEKNGGDYLMVKGTQQTLEYLTGILSDRNIPHKYLRKQVNVYTLSPSELETAIKQANIPFETAFLKQN